MIVKLQHPALQFISLRSGKMHAREEASHYRASTMCGLAIPETIMPEKGERDVHKGSMRAMPHVTAHVSYCGEI
jgi:hypothetical protein